MPDFPKLDQNDLERSWNALIQALEDMENNRIQGNEKSIFTEQLKDRIVTAVKMSYRSISGSPSGSLTPAALGEEVFDTAGANWYKATGLTNTDWKLIT